MNVQKLTQKSMEAVQLAQNIAEEHDNQQIEQCHVLLALMMQDGGLVPQLLTKMGVMQTAMSVEIFRKMIEILETDANILMGKERDDAEKRKQFEEVFYRIQKMEWKEQKIIMQTIDSLIDSFNEYR